MNSNHKSKKQKVEPVLPPLSLDMGAIRAVTANLKHANEAVNWSEKQECAANEECAKLTKLGKALPVNSPDTVWKLSPVQLTMEQETETRSDENKELYKSQEINGLTIDGGRRKSRKSRKAKKSKKTRKSRKKHKKSKKSKKRKNEKKLK